MLDDAGLTAYRVSTRLLVPLLELAGLEEDPGTADESVEAAAMVERWAALLANAAAGDAGADVQPAFPRILAELTPAQAAALEWLATQPAGTNFPTFLERFGYDQMVGGDWSEANIQAANLDRLRLVAYAAAWGGPRPVGAPPMPPSHGVSLSDLGAAFLRACTAPTGAQES